MEAENSYETDVEENYVSVDESHQSRKKQKLQDENDYKVDPLVFRKKLAKMFIVDGLPFRTVEGDAFREMLTYLSPGLDIPSRITLINDCYNIYQEEKEKLKKMLKDISSRVCLAIDIWSNMQEENFMCLTAHFIDNDWKLQKKMLNFCPLDSREGEAISKTIERCLQEWEINNVFTITVDSASSNDVAMQYVKRMFMDSGRAILNGNFMRVKCVTDIINSVVVDKLDEMSVAVSKVRSVVRYIKPSPARLEDFRKCVEFEKIKSEKSLCLDDPTRWNSTYLMLDAAQSYENAFKLYEDKYPDFKLDLELEHGIPSSDEWKDVRILCSLMRTFHDFSSNICGSSHITSTDYFNVEYKLLREWMSFFDDDYMCLMDEKIKHRYERYCGKVEEINSLMFIALILDPRFKFKLVKIMISNIVGDVKGTELSNKVSSTMSDLFGEYKLKLDSSVCVNTTSTTTSSSTSNTSTLKYGGPLPGIEEWLLEIAAEDKRSELENYLTHHLGTVNDDFDPLSWWNKNSQEFPVLSTIARDVLAIPISTTAYDSPYYIGEHVLDLYRSSLTPKILQALICSRDWIRGPGRIINTEEDLGDVEDIEAEPAESSGIDAAMDLN